MPEAGPISLDSIVAATSEQVSCALGDEAAILNLENSVYYGLDPVGARIWNLIQEPRSVRELRELVISEYEVAPDQCEADLLALLHQMRSEGLVKISDKVAAQGAGLL